VDEAELSAMIKPLGTHNIRAKRIISLSQAILSDPPNLSDLRTSRCMMSTVSPSKRERYPATPISHLPGAGPYALDSYRIFCTTSQDMFSEEWTNVIPSDKELVRYLVR
jgi:methyl-CpG-binding domain protein 4